MLSIRPRHGRLLAVKLMSPNAAELSREAHSQLPRAGTSGCSMPLAKTKPAIEILHPQDKLNSCFGGKFPGLLKRKQ